MNSGIPAESVPGGTREDTGGAAVGKGRDRTGHQPLFVPDPRASSGAGPSEPLGVRTDVTNEQYHRGPGISKSGLDLVARSPAHYQQAKITPRAPSPALAIGTVFHTAVLEPHLIDDVCVVGLDLARRSKADKETWAQFEAEHLGKIIIRRDDLSLCLAMRDAVRAHPYAWPLLDPDNPGPAEVSAYWRDPSTGVLCRCRPDKVCTRGESPPLIVDLKSALDAGTTGASFYSFEKAAPSHRYHVSDAMTSAGWREATGEAPAGYIFVAVEKEPPFGIGIYRLDAAARERGRELLARDLDVYAWCLDRDDWPCYPPEIQELSLPRWAFYD